MKISPNCVSLTKNNRLHTKYTYKSCPTGAIFLAQIHKSDCRAPKTHSSHKSSLLDTNRTPAEHFFTARLVTNDTPVTPVQTETVATDAPRVRTPPLQWTSKLAIAFDDAFRQSGGDLSSYTGTTAKTVWLQLMAHYDDDDVRSLTLDQVKARLSNRRRRVRSSNQGIALNGSFEQEAALNGPFEQEAALNEHAEQEAFLSSANQTASSQPERMRVTRVAGQAFVSVLHFVLVFAAFIIGNSLSVVSNSSLMDYFRDYPVWDKLSYQVLDNLSFAAKIMFAFLNAYANSAVKALCPAVRCWAPPATLMLPAA